MQIILEMRTAEPLQKECSDDNQKVCHLLNVVGYVQYRVVFFYKSRKLAILALLSTLYSIIAGSLEAAYSLNWGAREIWGKGGGETLALL